MSRMVLEISPEVLLEHGVWQYGGATNIFSTFSLSAAVSADVILLGFCLLASSFVFLLGGGSGLTIFKFHYIAKP